jgi:hypothetical protein
MATMIGKHGAALALLWATVWTAAGLGAFEPARAAEAPLNVGIHDLLDHSDQYDGRLVVVTGYVGRVAWERGRRGSEYVELVLEEAGSGAPPHVATVTVVALTPPRVRACQHVLIQGVYHREGKQAGRPYEFFIDADAVIPDIPPESSRVPSDCEEKL